MDHADAVPKGILGRGDGHGLPVNVDLPFVRKINAGEHVHQCGFAAAVFPQQRQDLALMQLQVHGIVGHDLSEALGNVLHFNRARS